MTCDIERRALPANLCAWILIILAAWSLPHAELFLIPMVLRLVAMIINRRGWANLREALAKGKRKRIAPALKLLAVCLAVAGASWALVFLPILTDPVIHPARLVVGGGVLVAVSLILTVLGTLRTAAIIFSICFVATIGIGLAAASSEMTVPATAGLAGLIGSILAFSLANASQRQATAEAIVDNHRLEEELADALAHAEFLAFRDPLTGLLNRRSFFEKVDEWPNEMARHVLTIDLDHFKKINDSFGHPVGDRVLVEVSKVMKETIDALPNGEHCAVRMGGEEFAMIIGSDDSNFVELVAERLRQAIAQIADTIDMEGLVTTASIGICAWQPHRQLDDILSAADSALYRAKSRGRNRIVSAAA